MNIDESVGMVLRRYRITRKLSQEQLALSSEVDRTYIGMIERAEVKVTVSIIDKICKALGIKIVDFFSEVQEMLDEK